MRIFLKRNTIFFLIIFVGTGILGYYAINWSGNFVERTQRGYWLNLVETVGAAVNPDRVKNVSLDGLNTTSPDYLRLHEQMVLVNKVSQKEGLHPLYLMIKKEGKIIIIIDSAPATSTQYAPPNTEYVDAPTDLKELFIAGNTASVGPYIDRWGRFVSSFAVIKDIATGEPLAVLGADSDASYLEQLVRVRRLEIAGSVALIMILEIAIFFYLYRRFIFEQKLFESESQYRSLVEISPDIIFRVNNEGTFTFMSASAESLSGFTMEEMMGKNFSDFVPKEEYEKITGSFVRAKETEKVQREQTFIFTKARRKVFVEISISPIRNNLGQLVGFQGVLHDIDELKKTVEAAHQAAYEAGEARKAVLNVLEDVQSEKEKSELLARDLEKFKMAVDNASDHIVITDKEGVVLYANKAAEAITGYAGKDALNKKAAALWKLPMPKVYYDKMWDTIKNKKKVFTGEIRNRRKNGEEYDASISISPVLDKNKEIQFFVGLEKDITREKQIDRAKTEFVSLASHQLRTPLSAINWYAEMLMDGDAGKINKTQKEYLAEIYRGNQRMVELVNALLNVSRLELGTFSIEPEIANIADIAREVVKDETINIDKKQINFKQEYDKNLPAMQLDKKLAHIILQNLLSNAIKYTPPKGKVSLKIEIVKKDIKITVQDTGYGIPVGQQDRIFSKLFRADNVREKDTEGTGLGLYLVKSILDNTGGKIWFESKENEGTAFYITLPLLGMKKKEGTKSLS